jgi:uncharacterized membrane protein
MQALWCFIGVHGDSYIRHKPAKGQAPQISAPRDWRIHLHVDSAARMARHRSKSRPRARTAAVSRDALNSSTAPKQSQKGNVYLFARELDYLVHELEEECSVA